MEKYTIINNYTGDVSHMSEFYWNLAWAFVFALGICLGAIIF